MNTTSSTEEIYIGGYILRWAEDGYLYLIDAESLEEMAMDVETQHKFEDLIAEFWKENV
jgi:hypothetical protein